MPEQPSRWLVGALVLSLSPHHSFPPAPTLSRARRPVRAISWLLLSCRTDRALLIYAVAPLFTWLELLALSPRYPPSLATSLSRAWHTPVMGPGSSESGIELN